MPDDTESDLLHRGDDDAAVVVARLDLAAPPDPDAPATTTSSGVSTCATATATATARDDDDDGFTFAAAAAAAVAAPGMQAADDCVLPDSPVGSPVYPVFGRPRWWLPKTQQHEQEEEDLGTTIAAAAGTATVRVPLGRLLFEDRRCDDDGAPPSASEQHQQPATDADAELDGVPAETYCLWYPGVSVSPGRASPSPARCGKSGSTGSSILRWPRHRRRRRRSVVGVGVGVERSHSDDGKDKFVSFLGAATSSDDRGAGGEERHGWMNHDNHGSPVTGGGDGKSSTTSFLPCKQDLVGLFASAVTFRRSYLPF